MTGLQSIEIGNEQDFTLVVQGRSLILKERETNRRVKQLFLYLDAVDALKNLKDTHYFYLSVAPDIRLNHLESFRSNMASGMEKQSSRVVKNDEELRAELGGSSISLFNSGEHIIFSKFEKDETGRQTSRAEGDEPETYVEADSLAMNDIKFILHEALTLTLTLTLTITLTLTLPLTRWSPPSASAASYSAPSSHRCWHGGRTARAPAS